MRCDLYLPAGVTTASAGTLFSLFDARIFNVYDTIYNQTAHNSMRFQSVLLCGGSVRENSNIVIRFVQFETNIVTIQIIVSL